MSKQELYLALRTAYVMALKLPHDEFRLRHQWALCQMRNALAEYEGREAQEVQEDYEEVALLERVTKP